MSSEEMRYGILGEDTSTPAEKLEKYAGEVDWSYLRDHYQNGVLFFVDPSLDLAEVGAAITSDDKKQVAGWLKSADLVKIEALHASQWEDEKTDIKQQFQALVVSPFVLCRPVS